MTLTIGVDVGGTKVAGGVVDEPAGAGADRRGHPGGRPGRHPRTPSSRWSPSWPRRTRSTRSGSAPPAWIDAAGSTVLFAPNLAWRDEPLRDYVAKGGRPADRAGERRERGRLGGVPASVRPRHADDSMVMITVGTGIGGGIVLSGKLWRGAQRHRRRARATSSRCPDGHPCGCGRLGCLEQYASGNALVRFARAGAPAGAERAALLLELAGGDADGDHRPDGHRRRAAATRPARDAFAQIGYWLGVAMADLAQILDPQVLVVGGGVVDAGDLLMGPTRRLRTASSWPSAAGFPVAEVLARRDGQHGRRGRRRRPGPRGSTDGG